MIKLIKLMGFFTTVLYFILGIYVFGFLLRLASPYIMKYILKRFEKKMGGFQDPFDQKRSAKSKQPLKDKEEIVGDYIDFEEVKDDE